MKLLEFPHSHYCEKARWALDHKGATYQRVSITPGPHARKLKKIVPGTSVPVLLDGEIAIQGSSQIIDYLDETIQERPLMPSDENQRKECRALEEDFDQVFGVNLRRALYFHLLPHPAFIRHCFMSRSSWFERWLFAAAFPILKGGVVSTYGVNRDEVDKGMAEMEVALDRWDAILQPGHYLVGDRFTRADLGLASMLYFAALPIEFESPWPEELPSPEVRDLLESFQQRPTIQWVENIYRTHRVAHRTDQTRPIVL
jgi:glutathione S-transferase